MTKSDADFFIAEIKRRPTTLPPELKGLPCKTEADREALREKALAYFERHSGGIESPQLGDMTMKRIDHALALMRAFLETMPEPFRSAAIDSQEDREALASALRACAKRPAPTNAPEEIQI